MILFFFKINRDGFTPLHLAIIQGNLPLVNLLLSQNVNVNALDNEGHSIVHWAVGNEKFHICFNFYAMIFIVVIVKIISI